MKTYFVVLAVFFILYLSFGIINSVIENNIINGVNNFWYLITRLATILFCSMLGFHLITGWLMIFAKKSYLSYIGLLLLLSFVFSMAWAEADNLWEQTTFPWTLTIDSNSKIENFPFKGSERRASIRLYEEIEYYKNTFKGDFKGTISPRFMKIMIEQGRIVGFTGFLKSNEYQILFKIEKGKLKTK